MTQCMQVVYRSVNVLQPNCSVYASSTRWNFTNSSDQQRLEVFIRRSARCNLATAELLGLFEQLYRTADKRLLDSIASDTDHVLHRLLPPQYELRSII